MEQAGRPAGAVQGGISSEERRRELCLERPAWNPASAAARDLSKVRHGTSQGSDPRWSDEGGSERPQTCAGDYNGHRSWIRGRSCLENGSSEPSEKVGRSLHHAGTRPYCHHPAVNGLRGLRHEQHWHSRAIEGTVRVDD